VKDRAQIGDDAVMLRLGLAGPARQIIGAVAR
jgi:hypothetical protein